MEFLPGLRLIVWVSGLRQGFIFNALKCPAGIWQNLEMQLIVISGGSLGCALWEPSDTAGHLRMHWAFPAADRYPVPHVNRANMLISRETPMLIMRC